MTGLTPQIPVLLALAWALVEPDLVAREKLVGVEDASRAAWVRRRLSEGPHGMAPELAWEAVKRAQALVGPFDDRSAFSVPAALRTLGEVLRVEEGQPRVKNQDAWDAVCRVVSPDLLVAGRALGMCTPSADAPAPFALTWPPVLRVGRSRFDEACTGPLAETHAHLGACLPTCVLWALLVSGAMPADVTISPVLALPGDERAWRRALVEARGLLADLAGIPPCDDDAEETEHLERLRCALYDAAPFDHDPAVWPYDVMARPGRLFPTQTMARTTPERRIVHRALTAAVLRPTDHDARHRLDRYVSIRCAFNVLLSQLPGGRGLRQFHRWSSRRSALWMRQSARTGPGAARALRLGASGFQLAVEARLLDHWGPARGERHRLDLELRTGFPLDGHGARQFFIGMALGLQRVLEAWEYPDLGVGIVFHTRRRPKTDGVPPGLHDFERVWSLLVDHPEIRPLVVGLDAASEEISSPPRDYAAAYAWVRDKLDHHAEPDEHRRIHLGFTYHAGEDFRDLLTGIRHVDEAAHLLSMRPGDRIGHALSLSWPAEAFYIQRNDTFPTVADRALDLLGRPPSSAAATPPTSSRATPPTGSARSRARSARRPAKGSASTTCRSSPPRSTSTAPPPPQPCRPSSAPIRTPSSVRSPPS